MIYDKRAATNVLGCLMQKPELLINTDKYLLNKDDFENRLHRIVFSSIYNLFQNGAERITVNDLHSYLSKYPELYNTFNDQKGSDFVLAAEENAELVNFDFYYDRVRKLSILRRIKANGHSVENWFIEGEYDINQRQVLEKKLETATLQEIITSYQAEFFEIESEFINKRSFSYSKANDGLSELIESLRKSPEIGMPLQGKMFTTVSRGARKSKFYLCSGRSGAGKSRHAVGNAAYLAYPIRWSRKCDDWVNEGSNQKVLFITTELTEDEVQTIILANITGINEEKILNGSYTDDEYRRIEQAKIIMWKFKENFHLYHMPDPNVEQLNSNVRRLVIGQKIEYLFFDYIHTSPSLLAEFAGARIREDVALMLLSTALKNLANELDIFVWSGTQLNANAIDLDFVDEGGIRGSRAVIDKADFACALQLATNEKLKTISNLIKTGDIRPNMYYDIFKNRRGRHKRVRLWIDGDLGTARFTDLFLTDEFGNELPMDLLYAVDKNAKCDITALLSQPTENKTEINNLRPKKIDMNNITL